jgi:hypothetical protein
VDSLPTTLKGGTNGITFFICFLGTLINMTPLRKLSNSGENFLDKVTLSVIIEAIKSPEAKFALEKGLEVQRTYDIH